MDPRPLLDRHPSVAVRVDELAAAVERGAFRLVLLSTGDAQSGELGRALAVDLVRRRGFVAVHAGFGGGDPAAELAVGLRSLSEGRREVEQALRGPVARVAREVPRGLGAVAFAALGLLRDEAGRGPVLWVLEGLDAAGAPGAALLRQLAADCEIEPLPLLVIATLSPEPPPAFRLALRATEPWESRLRHSLGPVPEPDEDPTELPGPARPQRVELEAALARLEREGVGRPAAEDEAEALVRRVRSVGEVDLLPSAQLQLARARLADARPADARPAFAGTAGSARLLGDRASGRGALLGLLLLDLLAGDLDGVVETAEQLGPAAAADGPPRVAALAPSLATWASALRGHVPRAMALLSDQRELAEAPDCAETGVVAEGIAKALLARVARGEAARLAGLAGRRLLERARRAWAADGSLEAADRCARLVEEAGKLLP